MLLGMLRALLGPFVVVLDWATAHPEWVALPLFVWAIVWYWGRLQLLRIERRTEELVVQSAREALAQTSRLNSKSLYDRVYPTWARAVTGWAPFVPHRLELWPVRPNAEEIRKKLSFSPEWVTQRLARHGIEL